MIKSIGFVLSIALSAGFCAAQAPPPAPPAKVSVPVVAPVPPAPAKVGKPVLAPVPPVPPTPPPAWAKDAYSRGTFYLDRRDWNSALQAFDESIRQQARVDAASYWRAYTLGKMGRRTQAFQQLQQLSQRYPNSRWLADARALEVELKQASGQAVAPEKVDDEELKLIALNGLMMSDPERALPAIEKLLTGPSSPETKEQALFLLAQSSSPKAKEILARLAASSNPGMSEEMRRALLRVHLMNGDKQKLLEAARREPDPDLRREAMHMLGMAGGQAELAQLYTTEKDEDLRRELIHGLMMAGATDKLLEFSRTEKDPDLRRELIQAIGMGGGEKGASALLSMYATETDEDNKEAIVKGLMMQGNAKALISLAQKEKDPDMRREIIRTLAMTGGKDASDYLADLLK